VRTMYACVRADWRGWYEGYQVAAAVPALQRATHELDDVAQRDGPEQQMTARARLRGGATCADAVWRWEPEAKALKTRQPRVHATEDQRRRSADARLVQSYQYEY